MPVSNALVLVTLLAPQKNDYSLGWKLTDRDGTLSFSAVEIDQAVKKLQKDYPMDYRSSFDECDTLELLLETKHDMRTRSEGLVLFYPDSAKELGAISQDARSILESWSTQVKVAQNIVVTVPNHVV